jgi:cell division transport system permease protein
MRVPPVFTRALERAGGTGIGGAHVLPAARLSGPMPWVIAIMVALCVLAAGAALALANFAGRAQSGLEGGLTVQIAVADASERDAQARAAAALLARHPDVAAIRTVPEAELERLVEPWLGDAAGSGALVLPALIDVKLAQGAGAAAPARIEAALAEISPAARVDAQAGWLRPVFEAVRALRWLALTLIVLLTAAGAAVVWLAARNAFDANRPTIEIVHHLGAGDRQIAQLFQRSVLVDTALGGLVGLALGAAALVVLGGRFAALDAGVVNSGALAPRDWLLIALVPVLMTLVALFTARRTVLTRLGRML